MLKNLLPAATLALCLFLSACATNVQNTSRTFHTVVIDAGHGGHDSGTRSRSGCLEKDAALAVAMELDAKLRGAGFHTVMTRDSDVFVPLDTRARISNVQNDAIFVSIHFNDSRKRNVHGVEVHYKSESSRELAERIDCKLDTMCSDRGIHVATRQCWLNAGS
jgi:N-acetylmuramoyl-L-alanine amidase